MKLYKKLIGILVLISIAVFSKAQELTAPLVKITHGSLKGSVGKTVGDGKIYFAYRGIPYAKPPVGDLRFEPPVPNDPWNDTLDATKDGNICTQSGIIGLPIPNNSLVIGSEDCLFINVYTRDVKCCRPVMVSIHGGGFLNGASTYDLYSPDYFLDQDVVFVSMNYRLGIFGFLSTGDMAAPGNNGLKDQLLALKWVKENIAKFGGDPSKVTIAGESAGASSVSYLLQSPKSAGLYRAAIMQSGTSLSQWGLTRDSKEITKAIALSVGVEVLLSSSETIVKHLKKVNYKRLQIATAEMYALVGSFNHFDILVEKSLTRNNPMHGLPIGPVKEPEHEGAIFSEKSFQLLRQGKFNKVPMIMGHNSMELGLNKEFALLVRPYLRLVTAANKLAPIDLSASVIDRDLAGRLIIDKYFKGHILLIDTQQLGLLLSVDQFNRPTRKCVQLMCKHSKVYFYQFSYKGKVSNPHRTVNGVTHAEDLFYMFIYGNITDPGDILTRKRFVTMWTNFVKTLDPTSSDSQNVLQNVKWIPNISSTNPNKLNYLNFNTTLKMDVNPDQDNWIFYEKQIYGPYGDINYHDTY